MHIKYKNKFLLVDSVSVNSILWIKYNLKLITEKFQNYLRYYFNAVIELTNKIPQF